MSKMKDLKIRIANLIVAEEQVLEELQGLYPVGKTICCWLQHGQINPSIGEVIGYDGGRSGLVRIRLHSRTREVRSVSFSKILE